MKKRGLILFTKSPAADNVKTRLSSVLSKEERSALLASLIGQTVERIRQVRDCDIFISYAGGGEWFERFSLPMFAQEGEGLGERMRLAMERLFRAGYAEVALVGADIPMLDAGIIEEAFALLGKTDVVLGPALDGGYYLVASKRPAPEIFTGIVWSTPTVLKETLEAAGRAGLATALGRLLRDLDTPDDLSHYSPYSREE
jgi:rSAM/selenodomain-associated transferase 1